MSSSPRRFLTPAAPDSLGGWAVAVVAVLFLLAGVVGLVAHYRAPGRTDVLAVSAVAPYLMLGAPIALVVLLFGRLWLPAVAALIVTAVCVATQVPLYTSTTPPPDAKTITVMTSNLRLGLADAESVVDAARRHHVDVMMLEELTPEEQTRLEFKGLARLLPHHVSDPGAGAIGTGL